jgi:hypothetical protein
MFNEVQSLQQYKKAVSSAAKAGDTTMAIEKHF